MVPSPVEPLGQSGEGSAAAAGGGGVATEGASVGVAEGSSWGFALLTTDGAGLFSSSFEQPTPTAAAEVTRHNIAHFLVLAIFRLLAFLSARFVQARSVHTLSEYCGGTQATSRLSAIQRTRKVL
jgi:hypothetical protein